MIRYGISDVAQRPEDAHHHDDQERDRDQGLEEPEDDPEGELERDDRDGDEDDPGEDASAEATTSGFIHDMRVPRSRKGQTPFASARAAAVAASRPARRRRARR